MVARTCNWCQKAYEAEQRYLNRGQGICCSRECGIKYSVSQRYKNQKEKKPNVTCLNCNQEFWLKPSLVIKQKSYFCSKQCHESGKHLYKRGPSQSTEHIFCSVCSERTNSTKGICLLCFQSKQISDWLAGDNSVTLTKGSNIDTKKFVKEYLIKTRGDACEICGFCEKAPDGRSIIQMDHINGNCHDNRPENLKLLCPNHHAMTPTYGSLNRGSGRAHRRKTPVASPLSSGEAGPRN